MNLKIQKSSIKYFLNKIIRLFVEKKIVRQNKRILKTVFRNITAINAGASEGYFYTSKSSSYFYRQVGQKTAQLSFFEPLLYRCSPLRQPALPHSLGYCQDTLLKMTQKQKALSKEEELLLQDFSRNVSTKSNALFYGNAFIVSAVPICKFETFPSGSFIILMV